MRRVVTRCLRAVKLLATDGVIPRPLRWLAVVGLLPVPGPFDEAVLVLVAGLLWTFYRDRMREAWLAAQEPARTRSDTGRAGAARDQEHVR